MIQTEPYLRAEVEVLTSIPPPVGNTEAEAALRNLRDTRAQLFESSSDLTEQMRIAVLNIDRPGVLADFAANHFNLELPRKQALLEELDVAKRVHAVQQHASTQLEIARIQQKLQTDVSSQFTDMQRRAYLREQLRAIQKELGEGENEVGAQIGHLRQRLDEVKPPASVLVQTERELKRLNCVPPASAEFSVIVSYVETLAELPWNQLSEDNLDLHRAPRSGLASTRSSFRN